MSNSYSDSSSDEGIFSVIRGGNMETRSFFQKKEENSISVHPNQRNNQNNKHQLLKVNSPRTKLNLGTNSPYYEPKIQIDENQRTTSLFSDTNNSSVIFEPRRIQSNVDSGEVGIGTTCIVGKLSKTKQKNNNKNSNPFLDLFNQGSNQIEKKINQNFLSVNPLDDKLSRSSAGLESVIFQRTDNREHIDNAQESPDVSVRFPKSRVLKMKQITQPQQKKVTEKENKKENEGQKLELFNQLLFQNQQKDIDTNSPIFLEKIHNENNLIKKEIEQKKEHIKKLLEIAYQQKIKISQLSKQL
ncbi:hypothetical protein M0812_00284 [Anaeramoeba flamelloides]|uniref:Uncharacterized protein n=1 Tax=Anaeramoeba flamelloides TaxID=1746091 RepID=A0AAV8A0L4_9EUKA|nr:hypothetical protein M0812_00284 [Anaeramoeba flamelloides]